MPSSKIHTYEPTANPSWSSPTKQPSFPGHGENVNFNSHHYETATTSAYGIYLDDQQEAMKPSFFPDEVTKDANTPPPSTSPRGATPGVVPPRPKVLGGKNYQYVSFSTRRPVQLSSCPNCGQENVSTHTKTKVTGRTWGGVGCCCLVFWPLCWIPLVAKPCKQTNHYCENCGAKVGRVKPFEFGEE